MSDIEIDRDELRRIANHDLTELADAYENVLAVFEDACTALDKALITNGPGSQSHELHEQASESYAVTYTVLYKTSINIRGAVNTLLGIVDNYDLLENDLESTFNSNRIEAHENNIAGELDGRPGDIPTAPEDMELDFGEVDFESELNPDN